MLLKTGRQFLSQGLSSTAPAHKIKPPEIIPPLPAAARGFPQLPATARGCPPLPTAAHRYPRKRFQELLLRAPLHMCQRPGSRELNKLTQISVARFVRKLLCYLSETFSVFLPNITNNQRLEMLHSLRKNIVLLKRNPTFPTAAVPPDPANPGKIFLESALRPSLAHAPGVRMT